MLGFFLLVCFLCTILATVAFDFSFKWLNIKSVEWFIYFAVFYVAHLFCFVIWKFMYYNFSAIKQMFLIPEIINVYSISKWRANWIRAC